MAKNLTSILIRGVSKAQKRKLSKIAKEHKRSVNFIMLHAIDYYLGNDIMVSREITSGHVNNIVEENKSKIKI